ISGADYCAGQRAAADPNSSVRKFIRAVPVGDYLSFNYDCLLEQALLEEGRWNPFDGFGVKAEATGSETMGATAIKPLQQVVHLHGSLYLYPRDFDVAPSDANGTQWITAR